MNDTFYVTKKTKIKCPWGLVPMKELDEDGHGVFKMNGNTPYPIMNMMDNSTSNNLPDFQRCKNMANPDVLTERASELAVPGGQATVAASAPTMGACSCKPIFPAPWINASLQTLAGNMPTLNKNSCIVCAKGFGVITIEGMTAAGLISPAQIASYVYTPSGTGYTMQQDMNNYLKNNVWNRTDLSNDDKIAITVACFDSLSDEQKVDFNMYADARVIETPDGAPWTSSVVNWPDFPGIEKEKAEAVTRTNIPTNIDRIGYIGGNNFGVMDTKVYDMDERAIPYIDNPESYHEYTLDSANYCDAMDCLANKDRDGMNALIAKLNVGRDKPIPPINTDKEMNEICAKYDDFQNRCAGVTVAGNRVDSKYGLMGPAAPWDANDGSGNAYSGGAIQLNTPVGGLDLMRLGLLKAK